MGTEGPYRRAAALLCGLILVFFNVGQAAVINPVMPFIREELGMSHSDISLIVTLRQLAIVLATLAVDRYYERFGIRRGAALAFLPTLASGLCYGLAASKWACFAGSVFSGLAFAFGGMIPASMLMCRWFPRCKGLCIGVCSAGSGLAVLLTAGPMTRWVAARGLFYAESQWLAASAAAAILFSILVRDRPEEEGPPAPVRGGGAERAGNGRHGMARPMSRPDFMLLVVSFILYGFAGYCSWDNFTVAAAACGYDAAFIGSMTAYSGLMGILGKPLYGSVADALGNARASMVYIALVAAAHVGFVMMDGSNILWPYMVTLLMGAGCYAVMTVGLPLWAADVSNADPGGESYAARLKVMQTACSLGGLFIAPLPGIIADICGSYRPFFASVCAGLVAGVVIIALLYRKYWLCAADPKRRASVL